MSTLCQGQNKDGSVCSAYATIPSKFCGRHQDQAPKKAKRELVKFEQKKQAETSAEIARRAEEQKAEEIRKSNVADKILGIKDNDSLREAGQRVIIGLIDGTVDAKVGAAVTQLLKHQGELLEKSKPKEGVLGAGAKEHVIKMSFEMDQNEAWSLMQNFGIGYKKLAQEAELKALTVDETVDAEEVQTIKVEDKSEQRIENVHSEQSRGSEIDAGGETDLF